MNASASILRLVPAAQPSADPALRPTSFDTYVGQAEAISQLRRAVAAAKKGNWQLDHVLLTGMPGLGKTSMAQVIANELGGKLHVTSAPAIEHKGVLASLLTGLAEGDVLFIDEIHALDRKLAETIYTALEDPRVLDMPAGKRVIRVHLPKFTLVGATTHAGKLPAPLRDRFGITCQLRPYTTSELSQIVSGAAARMGVAIDADGCAEVAGRSRGTPRVALRLLRRVRDAGAVMIDRATAAAELDAIGVDHAGLVDLDRRYLAAVADRPVGLDAIAAMLGEDKQTLEDGIEPYLLQAGFIQRAARGRVATEVGRAHLAPPAPIEQIEIEQSEPIAPDVNVDIDPASTIPQMLWEEVAAS